MRVLCLLREIQERSGLTKAELEQELDMDPRTINKLLEDSDKEPWRLDRDALHRYLLFAHDRGADAFRVEADPIWRTFERSERVLILRGPGRADVSVEDHLIRYFGRLRARSNTTTSAQGVEEVRIPSESGQGFRDEGGHLFRGEGGHLSGLKAATFRR